MILVNGTHRKMQPSGDPDAVGGTGNDQVESRLFCASGGRGDRRDIHRSVNPNNTVVAAYLLRRWYGHVAVKTSATMFTTVALYPILAAGAIEKIRLGYTVPTVPDAYPGEVAGGANCGNDMVPAHGRGMSGGAVLWW